MEVSFSREETLRGGNVRIEKSRLSFFLFFVLIFILFLIYFSLFLFLELRVRINPQNTRRKTQEDDNV